jgi:hypothetical protein
MGENTENKQYKRVNNVRLPRKLRKSLHSAQQGSGIMGTAEHHKGQSLREKKAAVLKLLKPKFTY